MPSVCRRAYPALLTVGTPNLEAGGCESTFGFFFFFFNDTATTEIYTLSLHDALPIYRPQRSRPFASGPRGRPPERRSGGAGARLGPTRPARGRPHLATGGRRRGARCAPGRRSRPECRWLRPWHLPPPVQGRVGLRHLPPPLRGRVGVGGQRSGS